MAYEFKTERIVEFAETDMAGILHFSNYFRYMEAAEHAFFRSLGLSVHTHSPTGRSHGAWGAARVSVSCTYAQPLRYEDVVELHVVVKEKRTRSISYVVVFRKKGGAASEEPSLTEVARGEMTVVFIAKAEGRDELKAVSIPPEVDSRVEAAPPGLLA
ncbi:MAG: acyl-CoA thioesterase [Planctomycetota bacterium]|jgi:YbgC/YbaW family acyl-CoA thioester hydrolase